MLEQSTQRILSVSSTPVSVDPPHLVLQRELARRQITDGAAPPAAVALTGSAPGIDAGVYAIRNRITGRVYVSGDTDVEVGLDYDRAALNDKRHRNAALQADWDWFGADNFTFKVVARVEAPADRKVHGKLLQAVEFSREELGKIGRAHV